MERQLWNISWRDTISTISLTAVADMLLVKKAVELRYQQLNNFLQPSRPGHSLIRLSDSD
jgi:hypothetical protein